MATLYDCEYRNPWGLQNQSGVAGLVSSDLRFSNGQANIFNFPIVLDTVSPLMSIGVTPESTGISTYNIPITVEFQDGTTSTDVFLFTGLESPIVDIYILMDDPSFVINYSALLNGETLPTTGLTHTIDVNLDEPVKLRTITQIADFLTTIGIPASTTAGETYFPIGATPSIFCEAQGDPTASTTTTVNVTQDFSDVTITSEIVGAPSGLEDRVEALENADNTFNQSVITALNNNVQRAQEVASQANDGIVGLTFQLRDLMSRIEALENN